VTDSYEYDAFGNKINSTGATPNNYLYRGEQYDSDLGLYYLRARYYNPATGRFLSRDPEEPDMGNPKDPKTLHKYLYAGGDPVNATDPNGREVLVGTAGVDLWQATKDAVLATATAAAITCAYFKLDSAVVLLVQYGGSLNQLFSTGLCSYGSDCAALIARVESKMAEVKTRYYELMTDHLNLYNLAYDTPNPSLPPNSGTWVGHQTAFESAQQGLLNAIEAAERKGCRIPPDAVPSAQLPTPIYPMWK
jgi:RHS repeat-associated protein